MCVPWHFAVGIRVTFYSPWNAIRKRSPNPSSLAALAWAVIGNSMGFLILRHLDEPLSINEFKFPTEVPSGMVMFLYPSIIMEVGQDKGPWKTIFWLEPDLNSIHVCWIQGVCPPQEIQCHITTQSWRMPHNNTQHPSRQVKSLMCGHQKNQKHQHPITICQRLESKSHPDGDYENCRPVVPQPLQGRTSKAATWAFGATVEFGSQWSP